MKEFVIKLPNYIDKLKGIRKDTHCSLAAAIEILYARENFKNNMDFETACIMLKKKYYVKSIISEKLYQHEFCISGLTIDEIKGRWVAIEPGTYKELLLPDVF